MQNIIYNTFTSLLPSKKKTSPSGWISFSGECCVHNNESQDKRGRAGIAGGGDGVLSYHCFNCGFKAHWKPGYHLTYKVRKLFQSLDMEVSRLKRTRFGPIFLPSTLKKGKTLELSEKEINELKNYGK